MLTSTRCPVVAPQVAQRPAKVWTTRGSFHHRDLIHFQPSTPPPRLPRVEGAKQWTTRAPLRRVTWLPGGCAAPRGVAGHTTQGPHSTLTSYGYKPQANPHPHKPWAPSPLAGIGT